MRKENGVLYFKKNWFLKYVWLGNSLAAIFGNESQQYPKNLCSLFWGSLFGFFVATPVVLLVIIFGFFGIFIATVGAGFCGFCVKWREGIDGNMFYPYKHVGKKKISVAPWEVCAVILAVYIAVNHGSQFVALVANFIVLSIITTAVVIIGILVFLFKTTPGKVACEYIKSFKRKFCPLVVIEPSETK